MTDCTGFCYLDPSRAGAAGLLIRHAERDPILTGESVWEARLTEKGRTDARAFGERLSGFACNGAFASPIPRCMDTASLILNGWGHKDQRVTCDPLFLEAYINDGNRVRELFETCDPYRLILDHVDGMALPGFHSVADGSRLLLTSLLSRMRPGTLTLFVTHDSILMPFKYHYTRERWSADNWFPYLGGAAVYADDSTVLVDGRPVHI